MTKRPELVTETLSEATRIGEGINALWTGMETLLTNLVVHDTTGNTVLIP